MFVDVENLITLSHSEHPYANIPAHAQYDFILRNFLAMSQAFPYLQAGSQQGYIFNCMENNQDVEEAFEVTSIVGNFLCWDETGGLYPTIAQGLKALPRLLETHRFHANVLKKDMQLMLGDNLSPDYSPVTSTYLKKLYVMLASLDHIERAATMIAFEQHAEIMITALWGSLAKHFNVEPNKLGYFNMHVGGDDPAEVYHVQMTQKMVEKIVKTEADAKKLEIKVKEAFELNVAWCRDVVAKASESLYQDAV